MPSPSIQDSAYLASVSQTATETDTTFTDTNVSTGTAGVYVYVDGRRVSTNNEYDARIRLTPTGGVAVELTKYAGSATATAIGSEVTLPGVTFTPGTQIKVRFQVSGTSPTTLKVKVWAAASPEPAAWTISTTDINSRPPSSRRRRPHHLPIRQHHQRTHHRQVQQLQRRTAPALAAAATRRRSIQTTAFEPGGEPKARTPLPLPNRPTVQFS